MSPRGRTARSRQPAKSKSGVKLLTFDLDVNDRIKRFRSKALREVFIGKEREVWPRVIERQAKRWEKNFMTQGAEYGATWESSRRADYGYGRGDTLFDTGYMFDIFKQQIRTPDDFGENVVYWSLKSIPWGGGTEDRNPGAWLAHHQAGYTITWTGAKVPARPMINLDEKDKRYTSDVLRRWGRKRLEEALNA